MSYPNLKGGYAIIFFIAALSYLITGCQGPEHKTFHKRVKRTDITSEVELPKHYQHHSFLDQVHAYRRIYDRIDSKTINFDVDHIEGLFPILKNGFALVHAYMVQDKSHEGRNIHLALHTLNNLFKVAVKLEHEKKLSQHAFISLHLYLAALVDRYKGLPDQKITHFYNSASLKHLLTSKEPETILVPAAKRVISHKTIPPHVAIIYKDKTISGIHPRAFVEELLHDDYPLALALFDVAALPDTHRKDVYESSTARSKHHAHVSKSNGTTNLLLHDLSHIHEQAKMEELLLKNYGIDWREELKKIDAVRDRFKKSDPNAYKILTNGLFILSHELFQVSPQGYETITSKKHLPKNAKFPHVLSYIVKTMTTSGHTVTQKDHEFILRGIQDKHKSNLLPDKEKWDALSDQEKIPILQKAYKMFWALFVDIYKKQHIKF